jgi:hypothetical protein
MLRTRMQHQEAEQVAAAVSVATASGGWLAWLSSANEVLIMLATVIAIVSGGWALFDKIRTKWRDERAVSKAKEDRSKS